MPISNRAFSLKLLLQKRRKFRAKFRVFESQFDGGFEVTELGAAVIANADGFNGVDGLVDVFVSSAWILSSA